MKTFKYLYCRFYQLMCYVGNGDIAELAAIMFMTFIFTIHIVTIWMFIISVLHIAGVMKVSVIFVIIQMASFLTFLYYTLVYNGKSDIILENFKEETKSEKAKGRFILIAYIVISIILLYVSFYLKMMQNRRF
ncbi:MAG: hypothetical protein H7320_06425 [Ferruginibacter sp.]|nr:hypothetical protein [Ferruginibacter sp.]